MKWQAKVVLILLSVATVAANAQLPSNDPTGRNTQARGYWVDPSTGLTWAGKDNGKDVSWKGAVKYCGDLRLAGNSDWRLANTVELQGIYDKTASAPGFAGPRKKPMPFTWHVKGNLFLTGDQWTNVYIMDDRGRNSGYYDYFDFNEGRPNDDPSGWPYPNDGMRALCVRGSEK